jgi:uncharacterized protein (TIGR02246 family)
MLIAMTLLCCLGCQQGERVLVEPKADVEADIQAIKNIVAEWEAAVNTGDTDKIMSLYANNSIRIPTNQPAIKGKEAIRSSYQQLFDKYNFQDKYLVEDVNVGGDLAVAHIIWSTVVTPKAGGEPIIANGHWIMNLKKQPDGAWNCIYTIFSDESLVKPSTTE